MRAQQIHHTRRRAQAVRTANLVASQDGVIRIGETVGVHLEKGPPPPPPDKPPTDWWGMGKREAFKAVIKNVIEWGFDLLSSKRRRAA